MLINLIVILFNQTIDIFFDLTDLLCTACLLSLCFDCVSFHSSEGFSLLVLNFSLNALLFVQVAFKKSVIQVDLSQRLNASRTNSTIISLFQLSEFFDNKMNKVSQVVMMVDENLQQIFNPDALVLTQFEGFKLFYHECLVVRGVVY